MNRPLLEKILASDMSYHDNKQTNTGVKVNNKVVNIQYGIQSGTTQLPSTPIKPVAPLRYHNITVKGDDGVECCFSLYVRLEEFTIDNFIELYDKYGENAYIFNTIPCNWNVGYSSDESPSVGFGFFVNEDIVYLIGWTENPFYSSPELAQKIALFNKDSKQQLCTILDDCAPAEVIG